MGAKVYAWLAILGGLLMSAAYVIRGIKKAERNKIKLKNLKAKIVAQEEKDKVDEMSDDDVTAALNSMRDND